MDVKSLVYIHRLYRQSFTKLLDNRQVLKSINVIDIIFGQSIKHYRPAVCDHGMLFVFVQPIVHSLFKLAWLMD